MDKPKIEEVKELTSQDFAERFNKLSQETGFTIIPSLVWVARDDGTWSTKINLTIGKLPKEEK